MFSSLGSRVTLNRQPRTGLPRRTRGGRRLGGGLLGTWRSPAEGGEGHRHRARGDTVVVRCDDGRWSRAAMRCSPSARSPTLRSSAVTRPAWRSTRAATSDQSPLPDNVEHIYRAGHSQQAPALLGGLDAGAQDRRARGRRPQPVRGPPPLNYDKQRRPSSPIPRSPTSASPSRRLRRGAQDRVTKVPFAARPRPSSQRLERLRQDPV